MDFKTVPRLTAPTFLGVSLKMYFDHATSVDWARQIARIVARRAANVEVVILPSFPSLLGVAAAVAGTEIRLGAQNLSQHDAGPYTGEVAGLSLRQVGCRYVEVGHAERRRFYGESDVIVGRKLAAAWRVGLTPLLCLGESEPNRGDAAIACVEQLRSALESASQLRSAAASEPASARQDCPPLVIAYEPVWAIGVDAPATREHVRTVCGALRDYLAAHEPHRPTRLVYGGSAGPGLLAELGQSVDGLFLGRHAHDPGSFEAIWTEAAARGEATVRRTAY
ncbi:MAG: triose-phosphate isomerase [Bifidobacteriaceae bacterium]|nr:triose-phosphate isomerase [Bifidobacteriaceae bacterium]